ncbi:MAG: ATP-binding protein [Chitinispirillia bacterium]|nr:ATP-binding protein [Chitinispirillia bacterium]MCL2242407.1 ATP-binding protein [Chitinispirillia bacterium]
MGIRIRAILVIVLTNMLIILFSVLVGIGFVERNISISLETDLAVIADIADHFIANEIEVLKLKASMAARELKSAPGEDKWPEVLAQQVGSSNKFIGMAVFDSDGWIVATGGETPAIAGVADDKYVKRAYRGEKIVSSTYPAGSGLVFYVSVPVEGDKILVATLPGMYFREALSTFVIWQTGHIFMSDIEGYAIANPREHWVRERFNYILAAKEDPAYTELAATVTLMTQGMSGIGYYSVAGVQRTCSYRPVSRSSAGWSLGVVAPRPENPIKDTGNGLLVVGFVSIILNIVAAIIASNFIKKPFEKIRALKEEAELANRAKSSFLSTMSHEIRTPMNAILGITEIQLQNDTLPLPVREALERVYSSGDLLLSIINDILDLSKIEAGKLELSNDKYEIASLISDTAQLNMMRIGSKPIEFELNIEENIPANMAGDELRVKQILNNLLSNAFKYTASGKVRLTVSTQDTENKGEVLLCIRVSDTGQGMTKEQVGKLFEEYSRFNKEANRTTEGTGLGMSITRNLIRMMGGELYVESVPGEGSEFTVRIPQGRVGAEVLGKDMVENLHQFRTNSRSQMKRVQISREPMPYGKILIVDDVETNIYVAKGLMAPYDLSIESAGSGFAAIDKVKAGKTYDIIFMDHMMPEMDGIEATKILRGIGYDGAIVALTANAVAGQAEMFLGNGFDDFISKPVDIRQLNIVLNKLVRDKQLPEVREKARQQAETKKVEAANNRVQQMAMNSRFVKIFAQDARKSIAAIDALVTKGAPYGEDDIQTFVIHTHGMKSALAYVGKMDLSAAAQKLETLAKENNIDMMLAEIPAFLNALRTLTEELAPGEDDGDGIDAPSAKTETLLAGKEVDGLNITEGLERYGGDADAYIMILRSYAASVRSMLGAIETVSADKLPDYEVKVHGIKGISREVFAPAVAEAAYGLEKAAAAGDYAYVSERNPEFLETAWKLVKDVEALLEATISASTETKPKKDKPDEAALAKLCAACKVYDMDAMDEAMAEINKYEYESDNGLVDFLQSSFDTMEFDKIVDKLSS